MGPMKPKMPARLNDQAPGAPHPAPGPHMAGKPEDQHKVLGPTHPELFGGSAPMGAMGAPNMIANEGMPASPKPMPKKK